MSHSTIHSLALTVLLAPAVLFAAAPPADVAGMFSIQPPTTDIRPGMLKFHPATSDGARAFLEAYIPYTQSIEADVQKFSGGNLEKSYGALSTLSKKARARHTGAYHRSMKLATAHIQQFHADIGNLVDPGSTYLYIQKSAYLAYLVDQPTGRAYAAFPIAYGVKSSLGPKTGRGDLKTPETPEGERSPARTPFEAHPMVAEDPYPSYGCITRGIGVSSRDPRYSYLSGGWTVMVHGTPDPNCMGTRASHGCIRMLPAHISVLFDYLQDRCKIVIVP